MVFNSLEELIQTLFQLQLIDPVVLQSCLVGLDLQNNGPDDLIKTIEQRHLLTPYQLGRLRKGDTDNLIISNYKLLYRNDSGSFARVFRAATVGSDEIIALKILRQRWLSDPDMVNHFHREAEICQKLRHPNVVPIYDVGIEGDNHFFTMEFVVGGNLKDFLKIRKQLSPAEATGYLSQIAQGLEYALRMGVTHRDMKLTNILLNTDGVAKLADFGLAGDSESAIGLRGETPQHALEYATLEKATNVSRNDHRSDLFFTGALFYELLAGVPPYQPTRNRDERKNILRYMNIKPIRTHVPDLPKEVVHVVEKLLKFDPEQRYQSASELLADLEELQIQLGTHTIPGSASSSGTMPAVGKMKKPNAGRVKSSGEEKKKGPEKTTVICFENRPKFQNLLRDYFSKHNFRLLILTDPGRLLKRLKEDTPPCVLLMGQSLGKDISAIHNRAAEIAKEKQFGLVTVLSAKQNDLQAEMTENDYCHILKSPLDLRKLRTQISGILADLDSSRKAEAKSKDSRLIR